MLFVRAGRRASTPTGPRCPGVRARRWATPCWTATELDLRGLRHALRRRAAPGAASTPPDAAPRAGAAARRRRRPREGRAGRAGVSGRDDRPARLARGCGRLAQRPATEREAALERCELCGAPIAARAPPPARPRATASCCARAAPARCCSTAPRRRGGHYRLVPDRRLRARRLRARRRRVGGAAPAGRHGVLLPQQRRGRARAWPSTRARWGRPSRCSSSRRGRSSRRPTRCCATLEPDVEALLVNRARGARRHWLVPIDECYALVGLIRTHWRGLTGGAEVWEEIGRFFEELDRRSRPASRHDGGGDGSMRSASRQDRTTPRTRRASSRATRRATTRARPATCPTDARPPSARPASTPRRASRSTRGCRTSRRPRGRWRWRATSAARRAIPELAFAVAGRRARSSTRRCRRCASRCASTAPAAEPIRSVLLDVQVQIAAGAGALRRGRARAAVRAVRRAARTGARRCARCCGRARRSSCRRSRGSTVVELPVPCTLRPRGRWRRATSTRSATARCRSSSCSAARVFYAGADGPLQTARISWEHEAEYRAAGGGVEGDDGAPLPRHGLAAAAQGQLRPAAPPTSRATRWRRGRTPSTRCWRTSR